MTTNKLLQACFMILSFWSFAIGVNAQSGVGPGEGSISPEKKALIKEMLELSNPKSTIDAMLKAQAEQMEKQLPDIIWQAVAGMKELQSLTPKQREEMRLQVVSTSVRSSRRMHELIMEKVDFNKLIEDISLPLYDKYFSESELSDLLAFHKSPTGKKLIEVMPNLLTESMTRTTDILVPKIMEIMNQIQAEETQLARQQIQAAVKTIASKPATKTSRKRRRR